MEPERKQVFDYAKDFMFPNKARASRAEIVAIAEI
jgi:hypothetical protein